MVIGGKPRHAQKDRVLIPILLNGSFARIKRMRRVPSNSCEQPPSSRRADAAKKICFSTSLTSDNGSGFGKGRCGIRPQVELLAGLSDASARADRRPCEYGRYTDLARYQVDAWCYPLKHLLTREFLNPETLPWGVGNEVTSPRGVSRR